MIDSLYFSSRGGVKLFCGLQNKFRKALLFITEDLNGPSVCRLTLKIGSSTNWLNPRTYPSPPVLFHRLSFALKNWSPHRRSMSFGGVILNFAAYISANCLRVNPQPWRAEPKPTTPVVGSSCNRKRGIDQS